MKEVSAIVMAAGFGKRMKEITGGGVPKPMIEVDGEPIIFRTIRSLRRAGVRDVVVVIREGDDYSQDKLRSLVRITTQDTESHPGTAKAAENGLAIIPATVDRRVLVLNGDDSSLLLPLTIRDLVKKHQKGELDCCTLVVPRPKNDNRHRYLGESKIFLEDYNQQPKYAGVLVARYRWLDELLSKVLPEENGEYKITQMFELGRNTSRIEQVVLSDGRQWNDFNNPKDLVTLQNKLRLSTN